MSDQPARTVYIDGVYVPIEKINLGQFTRLVFWYRKRKQPGRAAVLERAIEVGRHEGRAAILAEITFPTKETAAKLQAEAAALVRETAASGRESGHKKTEAQ